MYRSVEFRDMRFNVFADWTKMLWEQYPLFKSREDLHKIPFQIFMDDETVSDQDLDRLLRFIILYCTRENNPLASETDLEIKAKTIWSLLHISEKDPLRKYVETWHPWVCRVMSVYLRLMDDQAYTSWLNTKIQFYQFSEYLLASLITAEDPERVIAAKEKISRLMPNLETTLRQKEDLLFPDKKAARGISELEMNILDKKTGFAEAVVADDFPKGPLEGNPVDLN